VLEKAKSIIERLGGSDVGQQKEQGAFVLQKLRGYFLILVFQREPLRVELIVNEGC